MKKVYLICLVLGIALMANAQEKDFNYVKSKYQNNVVSVNPNIVGEKGVKAMLLDESFETAVPPAGWTLASPDGGEGWNQQADGVTPVPGWTGGTVTVPEGGGNAIAFCTYTTGGAASNDQWLISPQISVTDGDMLSFYVINFFENFSDLLEVHVSTTNNQPASFTNELGSTSWDGTGSGAGEWAEVTYDLSAFDGQDVYIGFREIVADNQTNGAAIGIDLVKIGTPAAIDLGIVDIDLTPIFATGLMDITGTVQNYGSTNITTFDVIYTINSSDVSATYTVSGVDIAYGEILEFTHDVQYDFATAGAYNVSVEISNVNADTDENLDNNTLAIDVSAAEGVVQRRVLHEVLTSSTCGPCAGANPVIDGVVFDPANEPSSTTIKYQVSWPGDGDPYQTPMAADRVAYYGTTEVPDFWVDANNESGASYSQSAFDAYAAVPSFFEIEGEHTIVGNDVEVEVTITPNADFTGVCHVVVLENETTENVGSNGETEFHNVAMAMLPTSSGTDVTLVAGTPHTFTLTRDMSDTFVEEMFDLEIAMFLQVPGTKEVMQSNYSIVSYAGTDLVLTDVNVNAAIVDCAYSDASVIEATVFNYGSDDVTTFDISYSVDGGALVEETVTATIAGGESYTYAFTQTANLSAIGIHEIEVEIDFTADVYTENNTLSEAILSGDDVITVDLVFDNYPAETSWEIIDQATDIVVAEGSGYTEVGGTVSVDACVIEDACYEFIIYDGAGDGMCCAYGTGSYTVSRAGEVVGTGGEFTAQETIAVSISIDIELEDITVCSGEAITFVAVGAGTYDMEASAIDNTTAGTTTVTYTMAEGDDCEVSETFDVTVLTDVIDITAEDIIVCQGEAITFPTGGSGAFDPATVANDVAATTTVTYTINVGTACESSTTFDVTVNEAPEAVITLGDDFVISTTATDDIVWYLNDAAIDGATEQTYTCTEDGDYYIIVSNANCSTESNTVAVTGTDINSAFANAMYIYPNPASDKVYVEVDGYSNLSVKVIDYTGKVLISNENYTSDYIDISELSSGIYFIEVTNEAHESGMYKIVVE